MSIIELAERTAEIMAIQMTQGADAASNSENMAELQRLEQAGEKVPTPDQIRQRARAIVAAA